MLGAVDQVAAEHGTTDSAVALAWLRVQPTISAPISSARTGEQLAEQLPMLSLELSEEDLARLSDTA